MTGVNRIRLFAEQLNEMISIAGFNNIGDFAFLECICGILEARYKLTFTDKTKISPGLGRTRVL